VLVIFSDASEEEALQFLKQDTAGEASKEDDEIDEMEALLGEAE
jgi:hypothetical protein